MADQFVNTLLGFLSVVTSTLVGVVIWIAKIMLREQKQCRRTRKRLHLLEIQFATWACTKPNCAERCPMSTEQALRKLSEVEDDSSDDSAFDV